MDATLAIAGAGSHQFERLRPKKGGERDSRSPPSLLEEQLFLRMLVGGVRVPVSFAAMFVCRCRVLFCFGMTPMIVVVRGLSMMMSSFFMMCRCLVVMFTCRML